MSVTEDMGRGDPRWELLANPRAGLVIALVLWAVAGMLSLAMAIQGSADWIQSIDDAVYRLVVDNEVGALVWLGTFLGNFGSLMVTGPLMAGVVVYLAVKRRWNAVAVWVGAIAVAQLISVTMKNLYARPRPPLPLMETSSFSFPSGHTVTAAVFALGLVIILVPAERRRPLYWILAIAYTVAMAWGRVYVRAHWLSDVTAGAAIGAASLVTVALVVAHFLTRSVDGDGS